MLQSNHTKHKRALSGFSDLSYPANSKANLPLQQSKVNKDRYTSHSKLNNDLLMKPSNLNRKGKGSIIYANLPLKLNNEQIKKDTSIRFDNSIMNVSATTIRAATPNTKFSSINHKIKGINMNHNKNIIHTRNLSGNGINKLSNFNSIASNRDKTKGNLSNLTSSNTNSSKKQNITKYTSFYAPKTTRDDLNHSNIMSINKKSVDKNNSNSKFKNKPPLKGKHSNFNNDSILDKNNISVLSGVSNISGMKLNLNSKNLEKGMNRTNSDFNKTNISQNKSPLSSNSRHLSYNKFGIKAKINTNTNKLVNNNSNNNLNPEQTSYSNKIPKNKISYKNSNNIINNGTNNSNDISTNSSIKSKIEMNKDIKVPEKKNLEFITQIPIRYKEPENNNKIRG